MKTSRDIVYGRNPVSELLKTRPDRVQKIYIQKGVRLDPALWELIQELKVPVSQVSKDRLSRMSGSLHHQGVVARILPVETVFYRELIERTVSAGGIVTVVDHVEDPGNLGNIIRTSEVLGAKGVVIPGRRGAPLSEAVVKASSGAIFHISISVVTNIRNFLREFKKAGGFVVAIEVGGESIFDFEFPFPLALVIGGEDRGVSRLVLDESDFIVSIPMEGKTGSLNASSAFAISLAFAIRSKRLPKANKTG